MVVDVQGAPTLVHAVAVPFDVGQVAHRSSIVLMDCSIVFPLSVHILFCLAVPDPAEVSSAVGRLFLLLGKKEGFLKLLHKVATLGEPVRARVLFVIVWESGESREFFFDPDLEPQESIQPFGHHA